MQGERRSRATEDPEAWLGRRATTPDRHPKCGDPLRRIDPRGRSRGLLRGPAESRRPAEHPLGCATRGCDRGRRARAGRRVVRPPCRRSPTETKIHASASGSRARDDSARCLRAADQVGDVVVHLPHLGRERGADHRVVVRHGERLHPEVGEHRAGSRARSNASTAIAGIHRAGSGSAATPLVPPGAGVRPRGLEAREVELALRGEVAVQDRLGDAALARDLRRRRAPVAAVGEDPAGRVEHGLPALGRREARRRSCRSTASTASGAAPGCACGSSSRRRAPPRRRSRRSCRARACRPVTNWSANCGLRGGTETYEARIAPTSAIPSEPPTWRNVFSTRSATPALSTDTGRERRRRHRRHRQRHPDAADQQRRAGCPRSPSACRAARRAASETRDEGHPAGHQPARAEPVGQAPASGATRMIRIVIGRNVAPALIAE